MRRLSARDRVLLTSGLVALAGILLVFGVALPMRGRWVRLAREVAALRTKIADADAMYRQAPAMREEVRELRATARELSRAEKNVGPAIIREIDELTRDRRLRLISVRPGEPEELESCRKHTAVFEVEADFARVADLLYRLERPPYQLWVEGVDINSERTTGNQVRAKVSIAVYTLKSAGEKSDETT